MRKIRPNPQRGGLYGRVPHPGEATGTVGNTTLYDEPRKSHRSVQGLPKSKITKSLDDLCEGDNVMMDNGKIPDHVNLITVIKRLEENRKSRIPN